MNVRPYEKGDAPDIRRGYLEGLILQDGTFVTEGKEFVIKDDATGEASVSRRFLFVEEEGL